MLENKTPYTLPEKPMQQDYEAYTEEDFKVWKLLFQEQMNLLPSRTSKAYLKGLEVCGLSADEIPKIEKVNQRLNQSTGWNMFIVPGLIADKPFFEFLAERKFPVTTWLRSLANIKYLEEPDMFHDVFGHVPLLSNPSFSDFLEKLARIALKHIDDKEFIELLSRLYWFTVEFGLITEDGLKIFGAGLISSPGESVYSVESQSVPRISFDIKKIFRTPYYKHDYQKQYFIINSYEDLFNSLDKIELSANEVIKEGIG